MMPLYDQQLLSLHPCIDRGEHFACFPRNRSRRAHSTRAEEIRGETAFISRKVRSRALLGQGLPQMLRRQPDFFAELEKLILRELFRSIAGACLQLRRTS